MILFKLQWISMSMIFLCTLDMIFRLSSTSGHLIEIFWMVQSQLAYGRTYPSVQVLDCHCKISKKKLCIIYLLHWLPADLQWLTKNHYSEIELSILACQLLEWASLVLLVWLCKLYLWPIIYTCSYSKCSDLRNNSFSSILGDLNPPINVSLRYATFLLQWCIGYKCIHFFPSLFSCACPHMFC